MPFTEGCVADWQGCVLSPCLFIIVVEYVMIQARKRFARIVGREPGVQVANKFWHGGADTEIRLAGIIYADDTTLFADTEHVQTWLDCLALEARAVGLEVSKKTEALAVGLTNPPPPLFLLDGSRVLYRDRVKLLGSLLPSCEVDVEHRISLAWHALRQYRALWRKPLARSRNRTCSRSSSFLFSRMEPRRAGPSLPTWPASWTARSPACCDPFPE
eukprot:jgi/Mesvir1/6871/Mv26511-RA.1